MMDFQEKIIKKKYIIYAVFGLVIFLNIVFFPELLNHQDIKLNDMSYMIMNGDAANLPLNTQPSEVKATPATTEPVNPTMIQDQIIKPKSTGYLAILLLLLAACLGSFAYYAYKYRDQMSLLRLPRDNTKQKLNAYNKIHSPADDSYHLLQN
jgi:hypothetical protein